MDINALNKYLEKGELSTASLLTCKFDPVAFANVEPHVSDDVIYLAKLLIKHKNHISVQPTNLTRLMRKLEDLEKGGNTYVGKAVIPYGWSGQHINDSDSFYGTLDCPVSINEMDYLIKPIWAVEAINERFQEVVNVNKGKEVFVCTGAFDLNSLTQKKEVKRVSGGVIYLKGSVELPIVVVH